jgi:hypothetical protein
MVYSSRAAAKATFALNAAENFRLFRLVIMNLHLLRPMMPQHQAEIPLMTLSEFPEPPLSEVARFVWTANPVS